MNMIRDAARCGSGEPSPASRTRQTCIVSTTAASTHSSASADVPAPMLASPDRTPGHSRATA